MCAVTALDAGSGAHHLHAGVALVNVLHCEVAAAGAAAAAATLLHALMS
jgi:hypothetical protein